MSVKPQDAVPLKTHDRDFEQTRVSLARWLASRLPHANDVRVLPIETPRGTGVANETLLFEAAWTEDGRSRRQGFAARLGTQDSLWMDHDVSRQYRMYEALTGIPGLPIPPVFGYEPDPDVLGTPFFVAQRIEGQVPPDNPHFTQGGVFFDATPSQRRQMWEDAVRKLARLHQVDTDRVRFLDRPELGKSGLEQEFRHWRRYFDWARDGLEDPIIEKGFAWLEANLPNPAPTSLSWGDSRIGNMIFHNFQVMAILDWDQVSLAGPEADLAWWIQMDSHASELLPGIGTPDDLIDLWQAETGRKVRHLHWHRVFTALRLSAVRYKLYAQMVAAGIGTQEDFDHAITTSSIEHLALLLGVPRPGLSTDKLPELRRH